ncbi:tRNA (Guanine-1)-methyltransferase [Phytophthora infestans]|uniref:tRNA (guanine(9)-N(1))-methyltransferase n=1 Tax=Phytophthora infestans TaxID=4787 RepID=A0A833WKK6_PHYIN|nr:tRNA (Guanine-1)-methyltransferase [Phytophthora infestans]KAF4134021.1 tRNA (Guanine-1)-methyltransferase [Phytophthora infestans]
MRVTSVVLGVVIVSTCWALGLRGYRYGLQYISKPEKTTKKSRREMMRSNRRNRKDERLKTKKLERSLTLSVERENTTGEEKNEKRERIRMQRVEQYQKLEEAQSSGIQVVVDLAFALDQTTRESHSILKQLGCVYGYLKTCPLDRLLSLHLASCTQGLASICAQHGVPNWKIGRHEEPLEQLYDADKLVYLSPDSDNVLEHLDPAFVYIVGGIVDRSVRKGETKTKAASRGIRTARLPLQEHFEQLGSRVRTHIMNLDSVLIVLNEVANHGDWKRAFERAVPPRITRKKEPKNKQTSAKTT